MKRKTFDRIMRQHWKLKDGFGVDYSDRVFIEEACSILDLSPRTVWGWRLLGLMPPVRKSSGKVYWLRSDIEALVELTSLNEGTGSNV